MQDTLDLAMELRTEHATHRAGITRIATLLTSKKDNWDLLLMRNMLFSYESKPLRTKYCTEVLKFRMRLGKNILPTNYLNL